jgi:hypothetical protein
VFRVDHVDGNTPMTASGGIAVDGESRHANSAVIGNDD